MGRIRSGGSAASGAAAGALTVMTTLTTAEPAQQGDILLLGSDNQTYVASLPSASAPSLLWRPPAGGPSLDNGVIAGVAGVGASSLAGSGNDCYDVVKLSNGNVLHVWNDATAGKIKFAILNGDGGVVVAETAVAGAASPVSSGSNPSAVALQAGGFAIAYATAASTGVMTVFDNLGNVTTAQFTIEPNATAKNIRIAQLVNGNIAFIARHGAPVRYGIFTLAGAAVKASTVLFGGSLTSGERTIGIAGLTGGGFVATYQDAAATSVIYHQRFDATGAALGGSLQLTSVGVNANGFCYVVGLTGGGYAVAGCLNGSGFKLGIYDANSAIQGGGVVTLGTGGVEIYGNQLWIAAAPNGDVGACFAIGGTGLTAARYSGAGAVVVAPKSIDGAGSSSAFITFNADGSAIATGTISNVAKVYQLSAAFGVTNAVLSLLQTPPTYPRIVAVPVTSTVAPTGACFLVSMQPSAGGQLVSGVWFKNRIAMALTGVAAASALAGSAVLVQTTGVATLRQGFSANWATNQNGANPPGQRMNVIGNTVVLYGIQPAAQTSIN